MLTAALVNAVDTAKLVSAGVRIAAVWPYPPMMPMNWDGEIDRRLPEGEQQTTELADRLRRERPVPAAAFRGRLRNRLLTASPGSRSLAAPDWEEVAAVSAGLGLLCLVVAALGLAGAGPF